jgi:hypothetical protein
MLSSLRIPQAPYLREANNYWAARWEATATNNANVIHRAVGTPLHCWAALSKWDIVIE